MFFWRIEDRKRKNVKERKRDKEREKKRKKGSTTVLSLLEEGLVVFSCRIEDRKRKKESEKKRKGKRERNSITVLSLLEEGSVVFMAYNHQLRPTTGCTKIKGVVEIKRGHKKSPSPPPLKTS